jgi:alkanesulfonate monooxygenase SsuD/methylene tetrahydromethanopterin reductase-like flavin-dependent oxidoreductase (luciferase family)
VVRLALSRQVLRYEGDHIALPLPDGPGKALRLSVEPVREDIPVYLAALGPKNLELAGEIADGWLAMFFSPERADAQLQHIRAGRAKVGKDLTGYDVVPTVPIVVGDDLEACSAPIRDYAALYIGGMGSRDKNFYNDLAVRMGYADAAADVQAKYLAREYDQAAAAVPHEFIERTSLIGGLERIADRMAAFAASGATTLTLTTYAESVDERIATLRTAVTALDLSGAGE